MAYDDSYDDSEGAIDDGQTEESSPNTDVVDYSGAMEMVRNALNYGRQKHGLPTVQAKQQAAPTSAIPDEEGESYEPDNDSDDESQPQMAGGAVAEDIMASNDATDDGPQYGKPEFRDIAENGEEPPISGDNLARDIPEQTGIPTQAPISGDNLARDIPEQTAIPPDAPALPQGSDPMTAGGAAPTGDDNSGAIPVSGAPDDNSGAAPVMGGQAPGAPTQTGDNPDAPHMLLRNGVNAVISYLQGKGGAEAKPLVEAAEAHIHGNPAEKAQGAVAALAAKNPEEGFAAVQYNRAVYNAKAGFAYAALNGLGRAPDLVAATKAATQATPHLLDGTLLTFAPGEGGVTASANGEKMNLTIPQFNAFLDIRKSGQFDRIFEQGGGLVALKEIMKGPGEPPASGQAGAGTIGQPAAPLGAGPRSTPVQPAQPQSNKLSEGAKEHILSRDEFHKLYPDAQDQALERIRAKNEWHGTPRDRQAELQTAHKNKMEEGEQANKGRNTRAFAGMDSREKIAMDRLKDQAIAREQANGRNAVSSMEKIIVGKMSNGIALTKQEQAVVDQVQQRAGQALSGGPQAPQAPQPQQAAPPQPGMKQFNGKWYTRDQYKQEFGR